MMIVMMKITAVTEKSDNCNENTMTVKLNTTMMNDCDGNADNNM